MKQIRRFQNLFTTFCLWLNFKFFAIFFVWLLPGRWAFLNMFLNRGHSHGHDFNHMGGQSN